MASESVPFLETSRSNSSISCTEEHQRRHRKPSLWPWMIHLLVFLSYTGAFLIFARPRLPVVMTTSLHPLPGLRVQTRISTYTDFEESIHAGPPSPELDQAWHQLFENMAIRVGDDELLASNQTSVRLPDGGGNLAWLGVFHELHCIKMVRQWNYRKHYHPEAQDDGSLTHWDVHLDHCLDLLRSAAMCRADTTLTTFGWAEKPQPMLNTRLLPRKCVDWDVLMRSVQHRAVDQEEVAALRNPLLGPA